MGVYAACTFFQGDVRLFRNKDLGIISPVLKIQDYASCDFTVEFVFEETSVRTAFAGSVGAVAIVDENLHNAAGVVQLADSRGKDNSNRWFEEIFVSLPTTWR